MLIQDPCPFRSRAAILASQHEPGKKRGKHTDSGERLDLNVDLRQGEDPPTFLWLLFGVGGDWLPLSLEVRRAARSHGHSHVHIACGSTIDQKLRKEF